MHRSLGLALAALAGLTCQPSTSRPTFAPVPEAAAVEVRLRVPEATERLAAALQADSIPITRVEKRDGYIETPWFDAATGRPTGRRPLGAGVVRVRGWVDPTRPRYSVLTVETIVRSIDDPSLPARELETAAPASHPTVERVLGVLQELGERLGDRPLAADKRPGLRAAPPGDEEQPPAGDEAPAEAAPAKPTPAPEPKPPPAGPAPAKPAAAKPAPAKPAPAKPAPAKPTPSRPTPQPTRLAPVRLDRYSVQIAAVKTRTEADKAIASVKPLGMIAGIVEENRLLKVRIGGFATRRAARLTANRINAKLRVGAFVVPPRR